MPDVEFPDEWSDWIHEIQDGGTIPYEGIEFIEEHFSEWANATDTLGISPDVAALGIDFGYDSPEDIGSITMHAEGEDWWIEIDGEVYEVDPENVASIWDWWELADYYDFDIDKDINTPGGEGA
jgi:hypothetical protein